MRNNLNNEEKTVDTKANKSKNNKSAVQPKKTKSAQKHDVQPKEETLDANDNKSKNDKSDVCEKGAVDSDEPVRKEKADEPSENEQEKLDAKKSKNDKSDVCAETAGDIDELIILKRQNTTDISLRRSARVQQKKNKVKALVKEAKDKYMKKVASQFILGESSVMYCPPGILWLIWSEGEKCSG